MNHCTLTNLHAYNIGSAARAVSSAGLEQGTSNSQAGGSNPPQPANL